MDKEKIRQEMVRIAATKNDQNWESVRRVLWILSGMLYDDLND